MEPKFINHCAHTHRNIREMMFASLGKLRITLYSVVGALSLLTAVLILKDGFDSSGIALILMGVLLFMLAYLHPILAARQQYRRNQVLTDGKELTPTELRFYDDHVVTYNETVDREVTFTYDKFKKLRRTKHLYLIRLPERLYLLVDREGFTKGDPAEFEAYIRGILKK